MDGVDVGAVVCGVDRVLRVEAEPGIHVVTGTSGTTIFAAQSVSLRAGEVQSVALVCPGQ
jgi:hypothetical protein